MHTAMRFFFARCLPALAAVTAACSSAAAQQQPILVKGVVRDSATGRQLEGVIVTLGAAAGNRVARTDEAGGFAFSRVAAGAYPISFRRLGYEASERSLDVHAGMDSIIVEMRRVASLDTVRVRATNQGIYGVVGTAHDLRPLAAAVVQVFGHEKTSTDSSGHFFISIKNPGPYLVRATFPGYEDQAVSVVVRQNEGVEMALLLDSATTPQSHRWAGAYMDLADRMIARKPSSAMVTASELRESGQSGLVDALRGSPSFQKSVLRVGGSACVFVDGVPQPGMSVEAFNALEIEAVEAYTRSSDGSNNLARRWPRGFPCAPTGESNAGASSNDLVQWIVIWLKR